MPPLPEQPNGKTPYPRPDTRPSAAGPEGPSPEGFTNIVPEPETRRKRYPLPVVIPPPYHGIVGTVGLHRLLNLPFPVEQASESERHVQPAVEKSFVNRAAESVRISGMRFETDRRGGTGEAELCSSSFRNDWTHNSRIYAHSAAANRSAVIDTDRQGMR